MPNMNIPEGYEEYKKKKLKAQKDIEKYLKETEWKTKFYIM